MYVCMVNMKRRKQIWDYLNTYIHTYIHTCIHIHTHTYIHIHAFKADYLNPMLRCYLSLRAGVRPSDATIFLQEMGIFISITLVQYYHYHRYDILPVFVYAHKICLCFVQMYKCMNGCMDVCMYVCMYVCNVFCMYMFILVRKKCVCKCIYVSMYICMYVCMYVCMCI